MGDEPKRGSIDKRSVKVFTVIPQVRETVTEVKKKKKEKKRKKKKKREREKRKKERKPRTFVQLFEEILDCFLFAL